MEVKEKCIHCNGENTITIIMYSYGGVAVYPIKDNGKTAWRAPSAPVYGILCTDCGTISKLFIKDDHLSKIKAKIQK